MSELALSHSGVRLEIGQQRIGEFGYHVLWPESRLAWGRKEQWEGRWGLMG